MTLEFQNNISNHLISVFSKSIPNNWDEVKKRIVRTLADELLKKLSGIPSPQGKLIGEIKEDIFQNYKIGA